MLPQGSGHELMRVAVLSHTYVEPENRKKLHALARHGADITLFAPASWSDGTLTRRWTLRDESEQGVKLVPVRVKRLRASPAAAWWHLGPLERQLESGNFELLHMEEEPWSFAAAGSVRLARRFNVPSSLFTWQNLANHPGWPLSTLQRWTLVRATGWIAGNHAAAEILRRVDRNKPVTVLPQIGIDLPAADSPSQSHETMRVGYVGRLVPAKGVDDLLDAVSRIPHGLRWSLLVVGGGPDATMLENKARQLQIQSRVDFRGSIPHGAVGDVWREIDVLVLPSRTTRHWAEQFGHVLIEAMASGIATVGSSSGAIPEVIGDGGVIFPEGDHRALADVLTKLASESGALAKLKAAARGRAAAFTHDRVAEDLVAFWQTLLGGSSG